MAKIDKTQLNATIEEMKNALDDANDLISIRNVLYILLDQLQAIINP